MVKSIKKENSKEVDVVYDISLDGTVVNALGMNVVSNTDGFNFKQPDVFRYTDENPYISTGVGRNTKEGKAYTGIYADIAEFEDLFLRVKMGLGLDEIIAASGNLSRKNYFDLFPNGKMKFVGNTLKSKKMPGYIKKFINAGAMLLAQENGAEFIETYYKHLEDIYNYRVPLHEIAMKGKVKKTTDEYRAYCQEKNSDGSKKSRQAWYELIVANNLDAHIGDTIYYINVGKKKGDSDVKRTTKYFQVRNGVNTDITKEFISTHKKYQTELKTQGVKPLGISKFFRDKELLKKYFGPAPIVDEDTVELNCVYIPTELIEGEEPVYCSDHEEYEYNLPKYIEAFNKRAHALMVCFDRNVREKICVNNPENRGYFTKEECQLVVGQPYKAGDQDTYAALMTMDRREVDFWLRCGEEPVYWRECGMDWEKMKEEHMALVAREQTEQFEELDKKYEEALTKITREEIDNFYEDGVMPPALNDLVYLVYENDTLLFKFKDLPDLTPRSGGSVIEDLVYLTEAEIAERGLI